MIYIRLSATLHTFIRNFTYVYPQLFTPQKHLKSFNNNRLQRFPRFDPIVLSIVLSIANTLKEYIYSHINFFNIFFKRQKHRQKQKCL